MARRRLALALLCLSTALAGNNGEHASFDTDGDGCVTCVELGTVKGGCSSQVQRWVNEHDTSGDQCLDVDEWNAALNGGKKQSSGSSADEDDDEGPVSKAEDDDDGEEEPGGPYDDDDEDEGEEGEDDEYDRAWAAAIESCRRDSSGDSLGLVPLLVLLVITNLLSAGFIFVKRRLLFKSSSPLAAGDASAMGSSQEMPVVVSAVPVSQAQP